MKSILSAPERLANPPSSSKSLSDAVPSDKEVISTAIPEEKQEEGEDDSPRDIPDQPPAGKASPVLRIGGDLESESHTEEKSADLPTPVALDRRQLSDTGVKFHIGAPYYHPTVTYYPIVILLSFAYSSWATLKVLVFPEIMWCILNI